MSAPGRLRFIASLPERGLRAIAAGIFGTVHEAAQVAFPRLVRRSRFYEVTAKNALRIAIELVGRVESGAKEEGEPAAGRVAVKKAAGNVVEFGSIAAFGFSPLWLLAGAADILQGSRVYLRALEGELQAAGVLAEGATFASVDDLLSAFEGSAGHTASIMDMPPLEVVELRRSLGELRADAASLPSPRELAALFDGLKRTALAERRPLLDVSAGVGLAFLTSARNVTRDHLLVPYREDWRPLRAEGFGAYSRRVAGPYREAIAGHLDPQRPTWTERGLQAFAGAIARARARLGR